MNYKSIFTLIMFSAMSAFGNDGFYQGAGSTLIPVKNKGLRVLKEDLIISPVESPRCFDMTYEGKKIEGMNLAYELDTSTMFAVPGNPIPCDSWSPTRLMTHWKADARYEIEAYENQVDVVMGFPIPMWGAEWVASDGLVGMGALGVADFKTYINGREIINKEIKWVESVGDSKRKQLAYVWKANFNTGEKYILETKYEFGVDYSAGFYKGREYPENESPWFLEKHGRGMAMRMVYYLTPLKLWAPPPPNKVAIKIELPSHLPARYIIPISPKPSCLSKSVIYYEFMNELPNKELELVYPGIKKKDQFINDYIDTSAEYLRWEKTIGGPKTKIACDLLREMQGQANSPETIQKLSSISCVPQCGE